MNVPYVFRLFWAIVKPIIPARTLGRIHFLGDNYQEELLKYIPAENLPVRSLGPDLTGNLKIALFLFLYCF